MMKLMSDTIAYLRDLLVFKVKPDARSDEASTETRSVFAEQAPLLETDRVLELIDQFAAAEGRMKWAPNKKLHFEVAVIRAIQTLDQTTLDEVIENLNALRDGNPVAAVPGRGSGVKAEVARAREPRTTKSVANDSATDVNEIWSMVVTQIKTRHRLCTKRWRCLRAKSKLKPGARDESQQVDETGAKDAGEDGAGAVRAGRKDGRSAGGWRKNHGRSQWGGRCHFNQDRERDRRSRGCGISRGGHAEWGQAGDRTRKSHREFGDVKDYRWNGRGGAGFIVKIVKSVTTLKG